MFDNSKIRWGGGQLNLGVGEFLLLVQMKVVVDLAVQVCHPHLAEKFYTFIFTSPTPIWVFQTIKGTWKGS